MNDKCSIQIAWCLLPALLFITKEPPQIRFPSAGSVFVVFVDQASQSLQKGEADLIVFVDTVVKDLILIDVDVHRHDEFGARFGIGDVCYQNPDNSYRRKYMVAHHLSVNIGDRWRVGLYETVVYADSAGTRGLEWDYLIPVIFYRPVEFALGSEAGNVLLGMNVHYKLNDRIRLYGQIGLDEFKFSEVTAGDGWWANKYTVQLGAKLLEPIPGLFLQGEFNFARPYTFTHEGGDMAYAHYNQALAHPLGANFRELIIIANYYRGRFFAETHLQYSWRGLDPPGENWGSQVLLGYESREQEYGNETLQGVRTTTLYTDLRVGWIVNPGYNLRFEAGLRLRDFAPETSTLTSTNTTYFFVGLRTALQNHYYDF